MITLRIIFSADMNLINNLNLKYKLKGYFEMYLFRLKQIVEDYVKCEKKRTDEVREQAEKFVRRYNN